MCPIFSEAGSLMEDGLRAKRLASYDPASRVCGVVVAGKHANTLCSHTARFATRLKSYSFIAQEVAMFPVAQDICFFSNFRSSYWSSASPLLLIVTS
jgi:hypothetical protein